MYNQVEFTEQSFNTQVGPFHLDRWSDGTFSIRVNELILLYDLDYEEAYDKFEEIAEAHQTDITKH